MNFWKKNQFAIIYGILLVGFTVYAALDVFVIPHPQAVVAVTETPVKIDSSNELDLAEGPNGEATLQGPGVSISQSVPKPSDEKPKTRDGEVGKPPKDTDGQEGPAKSAKDNESKKTESPTNVDEAEKTETAENEDSSNKTDASNKSDLSLNTEDSTSTDTAANTDGTNSSDEASTETEKSTETQPPGNGPVAHIGDYVDGSITISVNQYREYDTDIYVAEVTLANAGLLKTAFAENTYGRNIKAKTSEIASSHGAILAINGDFYGARETGYVIRNGALYRNEPNPGAQDLVIYGDGSFSLISESKTTAEDLLNGGAIQVISFGPGLLSGGKILVSADTEVAVASPSNPRSAIGVVSGMHYFFVCSDGRTEESAGLTLLQLAQFMKGLGVKTGYNLDGGGSSAIYFNGALLNKPTTDGKKIVERTVSDILYIGY